jgi:DNA-directed RNA polymerase specialized sigma24 family protein
MSEADTLTRLLSAEEAHDPQAADELDRLVRGDLLRIAHRHKRAAGFDFGTDTSIAEMVGDAFRRLAGCGATTGQPDDRRKFFRYMSRKIHGDLIELKRREQLKPHDGSGDDRAAVPQGNLPLLLDLQTALSQFAQLDPDGVALIQFRYLLGCTFEEVAGLLNLSTTETLRVHQRALVWLKRELKAL